MSETITHTPPVKEKQAAPSKKIIQTLCWRGSQAEYLGGKFAARFAMLMVEDLLTVSQSESDGRVNITVFYR